MLVDLMCSKWRISNNNVLRLGDRATAPGNDADLLDHRLGISVGQAGPKKTTSWALAPSGIRGTQASLFYLERLIKNKQDWKIMLNFGDRG